MPGPKLADLAGSLLTTAAASLTQGAPARMYVSQGEPPFDCEQITVHVVRVRPKLLNPTDASKCMVIWTAALMVVLLRCALTPDEAGNIPSAVALQTQNMALAVDGWDLASGLSAAWGAGTWPGGLPGRNVTFGSVEPFTPPIQGGLTGWRQTVEAEML